MLFMPFQTALRGTFVSLMTIVLIKLPSFMGCPSQFYQKFSFYVSRGINREKWVEVG